MSGDGTAALSARDLRIAGSGGVAFEGVSLEVAPGEAVGLAVLGSTDLEPLLDVLAGLTRPQGGEVRWGHLSTEALRHARTAREEYRMARSIRLAVGYVSATASLLQNRTLEDNIALPVRYHGRDEAEVAAVVADLVRRLGIEDDAEKRPAGLPVGVRRRAELARALAIGPRALVLESPLSGLDRRSGEAVRKCLEWCREAGTGILAASHTPLEIGALCSRALVVDHGRPVGWLAGEDLVDKQLLADPEGLLRKLGRT
jgi:ABC-type multidrug transport system ATPase subunit